MFGFDNTAAVKKLAAGVRLDTPRGKETYRFKIGQQATSNGNGPVKSFIRINIVDRYKQNGFCYYVDQNGQVHRDKDLI